VVIIAELQFFEIKREAPFGDAGVFNQPLRDRTPTSLQTIDVDPAGREVALVMHLQMPVSAEHEAVVAVEPVGADDTASTDRMVKKDETAFRGHPAVTAAQDADGAPIRRVVISDL
jgi:hypothetical protein